MKRFNYILAACLLISIAAGCRKQGKLLPKEAYDVYAPFSKGDTLAYTDDTTTILMAVTDRYSYEEIVHGFCKCLSEAQLGFDLKEVSIGRDKWIKIWCHVGGNTSGYIWYGIDCYLNNTEGRQLSSVSGYTKSHDYVLLEEAMLLEYTDTLAVLKKDYGLVRFTDPDGHTWRLVGYEEDATD